MVGLGDLPGWWKEDLFSLVSMIPTQYQATGHDGGC